MTDIEREILRRFFPDPLLDALDSRWAKSFWYGEPEGAIADRSSDVSADAKIWQFTLEETEFYIRVWFRIEGAWVKDIEFHGPWDQRFQGLITLMGARDVLLSRRDTKTGRLCVHAHT